MLNGGEVRPFKETVLAPRTEESQPVGTLGESSQEVATNVKFLTVAIGNPILMVFLLRQRHLILALTNVAGRQPQLLLFPHGLVRPLYIPRNEMCVEKRGIHSRR